MKFPKDLLGIKDLNVDQINEILKTAKIMKEIIVKNNKKTPHLQGKTLLFASDFHVQNRRIYSIPGFSSAVGVEHLKRLLYPAIEQFNPDFFVFGKYEGNLRKFCCTYYAG